MLPTQMPMLIFNFDSSSASTPRWVAASPRSATRRAPSDAGTTSAATMLSSVSPAAASTRLTLSGSCVAAAPERPVHTHVASFASASPRVAHTSCVCRAVCCRWKPTSPFGTRIRQRLFYKTPRSRRSCGAPAGRTTVCTDPHNRTTSTASGTSCVTHAAAYGYVSCGQQQYIPHGSGGSGQMVRSTVRVRVRVMFS